MVLLNFNVVACKTQDQLEEAILSVLESPLNNYFIAYSYWNKSCEVLTRHLETAYFSPDNKRILFTINIWDIPYYMTMFIEMAKDRNVNGAPFILKYANTPQLIVMNKQSIRVVNNNSGIFEELAI